jgi:hypothetical protein
MSSEPSESKPKEGTVAESKTSLGKWLDDVNKFSLRSEIAKIRVKVTDKINSSVPSYMIPYPNESTLDVIKRPLYDLSDYAEENFPYAAKISRSHAPEIIGMYTVGTYLFSLRKLGEII